MIVGSDKIILKLLLPTWKQDLLLDVLSRTYVSSGWLYSGLPRLLIILRLLLLEKTRLLQHGLLMLCNIHIKWLLLRHINLLLLLQFFGGLVRDLWVSDIGLLVKFAAELLIPCHDLFNLACRFILIHFTWHHWYIYARLSNQVLRRLRHNIYQILMAMNSSGLATGQISHRGINCRQCRGVVAPVEQWCLSVLVVRTLGVI